MAKSMKLRVTVSSDETIRKLSNGEITEYGLYNLRFDNPRPVPGGIFCQKIFGPTHDFVCGCGIRRPASTKVCEHCGVEVIPSKVRRNRLGHIECGVPYINPLNLDILADALFLSKKALQKFLIGKAKFSMEIDPCGFIPMKDCDDRLSIKLEDGAIGPDSNPEEFGLFSLLKALVSMDADFSKIMEESKMASVRNCGKKSLLELINYTVQVSPPVLREAGISDGRMSYHPINQLYIRILRSTLRIKVLLSEEDKDKRYLLPFEGCILQKCINDLLSDGSKDHEGNPIESLIQRLPGKDGKMRDTLLGKRIDFSGRSVITSGPHLPIDTIGLPFKMGYELMKPEIIGELCRVLEQVGKIQNPMKMANRLYKEMDKTAVELCYILSEKALIMMNRAPSLHRYSVMGFKIKLHQGKNIEFPCMVCSPFNADFDGDQMAVHLILSDQAKAEFWKIDPKNNLMNSKTFNDPNMCPSHEAIVGLMTATADEAFYQL